MKKIAIFASGNGSNAENIVKYFQKNDTVKVQLVGSNNPEAKVLDRVSQYNVPTFIFNKENLMNGDVLEILKQKKIDFIVLAGFLLKIPKMIIVGPTTIRQVRLCKDVLFLV